MKKSSDDIITITAKELVDLLRLKTFIDAPARFGCTIDFGIIDDGLYDKRVGYIFANADQAFESLLARKAI